ncbi:hypothetical protein ACGC1H_004711 [Rhizoctonia solani]
MKHRNLGLVAATLFTFVYLSLFALNIVHLPGQLRLPTQHNSNYSNVETLGRNSSPITDDRLGLLHSLPYLAWLQLPGRVASIGSHPLPRFNLKTASVDLDSESQVLIIGGSWRDNLIHLGAADLNLSSTVTFTSSSLITMDEISPSATNGYLNSRIDLRRRRRAFAVTLDNTVPPSIRLELREDAALQPRDMDPSRFREEFEKALAHNRRLKEVVAAQRLRKGRKKKVNPTG